MGFFLKLIYRFFGIHEGNREKLSTFVQNVKKNKSYLISTIAVTSRKMSIEIYVISYIDIIKEPHTDKMYLKYHSMFSMFNTYATQA